MHFTGTTYRPPVEAMLGTKLLQVTIGCAHNKCAFCTMYAHDKFSVEPLWQVEEDIIELRKSSARIDRIFLVNGDAFVLSRQKLQKITDLIIKHIPEVSVITMYASINNIKAKSDADLVAIKEMRINDLWIGAESGNAQALLDINKGNTLDEAREQLLRLVKFGIRHNDGYMLGVGGKGKGVQYAMDAAKLINETKPSIVWFGTLSLFKGSKMHEAMEKGAFIPATELEILEEEIHTIQGITLENIPFYGIHPTNACSVHGMLPRDKEDMIGELKDYIAYADNEFLQSAQERHSL